MPIIEDAAVAAIDAAGGDMARGRHSDMSETWEGREGVEGMGTDKGAGAKGEGM